MSGSKSPRIFPLFRFEIVEFLAHLDSRKSELVSQDVSADAIHSAERTLSLVFLETRELRLRQFFTITHRTDVQLHIMAHNSILKRSEFWFDGSTLESIWEAFRSVTGIVLLLFREIKCKICRD